MEQSLEDQFYAENAARKLFFDRELTEPVPVRELIDFF